jgi:hypothetical protein
VCERDNDDGGGKGGHGRSFRLVVCPPDIFDNTLMR